METADNRFNFAAFTRKITKEIHVGGRFRRGKHAVDFFKSARERREFRADVVGKHLSVVFAKGSSNTGLLG